MYQPWKIEAMAESYLTDPDRLWMTRRTRKEKEELWWGLADNPRRRMLDSLMRHVTPGRYTIATVCQWTGKLWRIKWQMGHDYAIQPGRGQPGTRLPDGRELRMVITDIRSEMLRAISWEDCLREGIRLDSERYPFEWSWPGEPGGWLTPKEAFAALWGSIHAEQDTWADDPEVWVLTYKLVAR